MASGSGRMRLCTSLIAAIEPCGGERGALGRHGGADLHVVGVEEFDILLVSHPRERELVGRKPRLEMAARIGALRKADRLPGEVGDVPHGGRVADHHGALLEEDGRPRQQRRREVLGAENVGSIEKEDVVAAIAYRIEVAGRRVGVERHPAFRPEDARRDRAAKVRQQPGSLPILAEAQEAGTWGAAAADDLALLDAVEHAARGGDRCARGNQKDRDQGGDGETVQGRRPSFGDQRCDPGNSPTAFSSQ